MIIAGENWPGSEPRPVYNPWNGEVVGEVPWAGETELEQALAGAASARKSMREASRAERSGWCRSIANGLEQYLEGFAQTITEESGKPLKAARDEVRRAIATFTLASHEALRFDGEMVPIDVGAASAGYLGMTRRVACGPVAAVTPFNFPLNLVAHKVAAALAVGNPVLLKPAPATPLTAQKLGQLILECGIPREGFSCLNLENDLVSKLISDPRVAMLSFTGSAKVGWELKRQANRKKVALELGGNASVLVHSDANLEFAIPRLAAGGYAYAGQVCISVQHIRVQRSIYNEFVERYVAEVSQLQVGDPSDEQTVVGPLIRAGECQRIQQWVEEAVEAGAQLLLGGRAQPPCYLPTVLADVPATVRLGCQEVFGPVTTVSAYDHWDEALAQVQASPFGLQVGIFTRDLERVMKCWEELEVGSVIANDFPTFRVDNMPYGGVKESGFGREGVRYTMEEMSEPRLLVINRNPLR